MATATAPKKGTNKLAPMTFERALVLNLFRLIGVKGAAKETNEYLTGRLKNLADSLSEETLEELEDKDETAHELATSVLECLKRNQPLNVIDDEDEEDDEDTDLAGDEDEEDGEDDDGQPEADEDNEDNDEDSETEDDESDEESDDSDDEEDETPEDEEDEEMEVETPAPPKKKVATKPTKPTGKPAAKPTAKSKPGKPAAKPTKPAAKEAKPKKPGVIQEMIKLLAAANKKAPVTKAKIHAHLVKTFRDRNPDSMMATLNAQVPTGLKTEKGIVVKSVPFGDGKTGYYIADWGGYKLPKA